MNPILFIDFILFQMILNSFSQQKGLFWQL